MARDFECTLTELDVQAIEAVAETSNPGPATILLAKHRRRHGWTNRLETEIREVVPPERCEVGRLDRLERAGEKCDEPAQLALALAIAESLSRNGRHESARALLLRASTFARPRPDRERTARWLAIESVYVRRYDDALAALDVADASDEEHVGTTDCGTCNADDAFEARRRARTDWRVRALLGAHRWSLAIDLAEQRGGRDGVALTLLDHDYLFLDGERTTIADPQELLRALVELGIPDAGAANWLRVADDPTMSLQDLADRGCLQLLSWRVLRADEAELKAPCWLLGMHPLARRPGQNAMTDALIRSGRADVGRFLATWIKKPGKDDDVKTIRDSFAQWTWAWSNHQ
ncbi:MAG: hypothetical protein K8S98_15010 [Planctomycetes bacterium]|nr:hypothetical protein [Planctomycetota bacterium]